MKIIKDTGTQGTARSVTVFAETRAELDPNVAAQAMAREHLVKEGVAVRGLSNIPSVNPVNAAGEVTVPVATGAEKAAGYASTFQFVVDR